MTDLAGSRAGSGPLGEQPGVRRPAPRLSPYDPVIPSPLARQLEDAFRSSHQACLLAAVRVVRDTALAEEVVQEAFLAAWQHAPRRYDPARGPLGSWLMTLTRHKAIDAVRHAAHLRRVQHRVQAMTPPHRYEAAAEDAAVRRLAAHQLRNTLQELSADHQRVLLMAYWGGLSHSQIALQDGGPLGTVKTRTAAALARLRESLPAPTTIDHPVDAGINSGSVRRRAARSGRRGEFHPPAPTEPCVTVSRHTALLILAAGSGASIASGRSRWGWRRRTVPTRPGGVCVRAVPCTSVAPNAPSRC